MRNQPEHVEQSLFMQRVVLDSRTKNLLLTAVPNGGQRHKAVAAKLKAEGVKAGVPDILVFEWAPRAHAGMYCGLAIEMKVKPNKPTLAQVAWMDALKRRGWSCVVVYSADEAWAALASYLRFDP